MKILIADEKVAASPALRAMFESGSKNKRGAKGKKLAAKKRGAAAGQLVVACAPNKSGKAKAPERSCAGLDLGDQPELSATIMDALGIALLNRACGDQSHQLVEQAYAIRRKSFGSDHPYVAASQNSRARLFRERGDYAKAEEAVNDALRINRAVYGDQGLPLVVSLNELALIQLKQGHPDDAEKTANVGLAILKALGLTATDFYTTRLMDTRGRAETDLRKIAAADATFTELLAIDRIQVGKAHPKYLTHQANYAAVKALQGKAAVAESFYRQAIDVYLNVMGRPSHPNLVDLYAALGSLLRKNSPTSPKFKEAGELLFKVLRANEVIRGKGHVLVGHDHANVGRWQNEKGDTQAAIASFKRALSIYAQNVKAKRMSADHLYIAEALTWQGRILVESGVLASAAQAEPLLERAIVMSRIHLGPDNVGEAIASASLGRALYLQNKDTDRAKDLLNHAFPILLRAFGEKNALVKRVAQWIKDTAKNSVAGAP